MSNPTFSYIALLRGINVGGKNRLPMKDLTALFIEAGCQDVKTHVQSGNVVFRARPDLARRIPSLIERRIEEDFGLNVPVVSRTGAEILKVARGNPFLRSAASVDFLHVAFLADRPPAAKVKSLDPERSPRDEFVVRGGEIYLHLRNGAGRTKLTNAYFDTKLGTISTLRNWRTVLALVELAS